MEAQAFLDRVLSRLPASPPNPWHFAHWPHGGKPTEEAYGLLAVPGLDPAKVIEAVMDIGHYHGNVDHVAASRVIPDARFAPPDHVRFYQKVDLPVLGAVHQELVLHRMGTHKGYLVAGWELLVPETNALSAKEGFRMDYSHGVWLAAPGILGYGLGSAPKRDDVGFLKWKALTTGADVAAPRVIRGNIEGMARWATRR